MTYRITIVRTPQLDGKISYTMTVKHDVAYPATFEMCLPVAALRAGWEAVYAHKLHHVVFLDPIQDKLLPYLLSMPRSHKYLTVVLKEHDEVFASRMRWQPGSEEHIWYAIKPDPNPVIFSSESGYEYSKIEIPLQFLSFEELRRTCSFNSYLPDSARRIFDEIIAQRAANLTTEEDEDGTKTDRE